jgi:hypothetical protein
VGPIKKQKGTGLAHWLHRKARLAPSSLPGKGKLIARRVRKSFDQTFSKVWLFLCFFFLNK